MIDLARMKPLRTVALLGREAGLRVLEDSLLRNPKIDLCLVATHGQVPRHENPAQPKRPELPLYRGICKRAGVPLAIVDDLESGSQLSFLDDTGGLDLLVSLSWRRVVTSAALSRFTVACVNLHRGLLPGYEGARPVERMIADGATAAVITAHKMVAQVDAGPILATVHFRLDRDHSLAPAAQAEDVKQMLIPLYAPLLDLAIANVTASMESQSG